MLQVDIQIIEVVTNSKKVRSRDRTFQFLISKNLFPFFLSFCQGNSSARSPESLESSWKRAFKRLDQSPGAVCPRKHPRFSPELSKRIHGF
jgi:hypothetical protein